MKKICNYNDEHFEYYFTALGMALTGDSSKVCEFYYLVGQTASNGKTTILEICKSVLSIYVHSIEKGTFDLGNSKIHKEIAKWRGKRLCFGNELTETPKDREFLKSVCDGACIPYDVLYGTNELMPITFKLFLTSNHSLTVKNDAGLERRFRHMQMDSKFVKPGEVDYPDEDNFETRTFRQNPNFQLEMKTKYRAAFLQTICYYAKKFFETGMPLVPGDWQVEKEAVMQANDEFNDFFETAFDVAEHLSIAKKRVDERVKAEFKTKMNIRDQLKGIKVKFTYDSQERRTIDGAKFKGFYHGFGELPPVPLVFQGI